MLHMEMGELFVHMVVSRKILKLEVKLNIKLQTFTLEPTSKIDVITARNLEDLSSKQSRKQ